MTAGPPSARGGTAPLTGAAVASVAAVVAMVLCSPLIAGFSPTLYLQLDEIGMLDALGRHLAFAPGYAELIHRSVRGAGPLADPTLRLLAVIGPVTLASLALLAALRCVERRPATDLAPSHLRLVLGVGAALALMACCAVPSYTVDFWLSVAWGRMFAAGQNAYYESFTHAVFHGIPGGGFESFERFTYGPLWALISAGMARLAGERTLAAFALGKLVLLLSWSVTVAMITRAAARRGLRPALRAALLTAWLPPLLLLGLAEGHNDVTMLMFVALWAEAADRGDHRWTPLWLALAALTKLVAAPLAGLELFLAARRGALRRPGYWVSASVAIVLGLGLLAHYYEGEGFMASTAAMQRWIYWVPTTFVTSLARFLGHPVPERTVDLLLAALGLGGVALVLGRDLRRPSPSGWVASAAAIVGFTLATLTGHVWPWFALWLVPFAALGWPARWSVVALGYLLLIPTLDIAWVMRPDWSLRPWFDLPLYGVPLVLALILTLPGPRPAPLES